MATASAVAVTAVTGTDPLEAPARAAAAGATNNALRQLGASLGPAILGTFVAHARVPAVLDDATSHAALVTAVVLATGAALSAAVLRHER